MPGANAIIAGDAAECSGWAAAAYLPEKGLCLEETGWEKAEASWDGGSSGIKVPRPMPNVTVLARNFPNFPPKDEKSI